MKTPFTSSRRSGAARRLRRRLLAGLAAAVLAPAMAASAALVASARAGVVQVELAAGLPLLAGAVALVTAMALIVRWVCRPLSIACETAWQPVARDGSHLPGEWADLVAHIAHLRRSLRDARFAADARVEALEEANEHLRSRVASGSGPRLGADLSSAADRLLDARPRLRPCGRALSANELSLLGKIDGKRTVAEIIECGALPQDDAARAILDMLDRGALRV